MNWIKSNICSLPLEKVGEINSKMEIIICYFYWLDIEGMIVCLWFRDVFESVNQIETGDMYRMRYLNV